MASNALIRKNTATEILNSALGISIKAEPAIKPPKKDLDSLDP